MAASWRVVEGDCREVMAGLGEASVDAVVTDPPYGLEFMGKEWDWLSGQPGYNERGRITDRPASQVPYGRGGGVNSYQAGRPMQEWHEAWAREALRVLKPGGHLLAFGGTRTFHRLVCAVEDAGFEIRDTICWLYGSGFPKSLDVSKAIDKAAGAEREVLGERAHSSPKMEAGRGISGLRQAGSFAGEYEGERVQVPVTAPATPDAERWDGWGTALKPAHEPIVVARKPLAGTVAVNVLAHGTGALNVNGCRVEHAGADDLATSKSKNRGREDLVTSGVYGANRGQQSVNDEGRWPANVVLDEDAAAMLDAQAPDTGGGGFNGKGGAFGLGAVYGDTPTTDGARATGRIDENGGASRFFYCAKASSAERNAGLEGFTQRKAGIGDERPSGSSWERRAPEKNPNAPRGNTHPTVKPVDLMRWLVRLVTPPGGTVLDPFTGSGTTGIAALREGFSFVGIERESEYCRIARARIIGDAPLLNSVSEVAA